MTRLAKSVPPMIRRTIELCLQKDVARRIADIRDVRLALQGSFDYDAYLVRPSAMATSKRPSLVAAVLFVGAILVGAYLLSLRSGLSVPATVSRFVVTTPPSAMLASLGGNDIAISPDGRRFAYLAYAEGDREPTRAMQTSAVALYVRDLDGLEARLLPGTRVEDPRVRAPNPFFSPDGRSIGFWAPGRGVLRVSVDGGEPVKLFDDPQPAFVGATWASDDTIIYSSGRRLHRISAGEAGTPDALTPDAESQTPTGPFVGAPLLLPGERALLFTILQGNAASIAVLDLETREQRVLIEDGGNAFYAATGHILFARGTTPMAVPFDLSELAVTGEAVAVLQGIRHPAGLSAADYALSASGTLLYVPDDSAQFSTVGNNSAIVWVDRNGRVAGQAVRELVGNPRSPRLSSAGDRLALTTGPALDSDIWIFDLGGKPSLRLVEDGHNSRPVWSPDDREIAFQSAPRLGGAAGAVPGVAVSVIRTDGSELAPRRLRQGTTPSVVPQEWSAGGELLLVAQRNDSSDILAAPATPDGELRDVIATGYDEVSPALSPDGRWLAYVSNRTGRFEIWVNGYPEGPSIRVSQESGHSPRWAANGREIFYFQGTTMMAVPVQPGDEFSFDTAMALFDTDEGQYFVPPRPLFETYDVAPDGRFLMIQPRGGAREPPAVPFGSIVIIQNWIEELKELVPTN
jgi:serine/threonine-protein kinase